MIPAKPFDVSQVQKAQAEAPISLVMGQSDQPVGDLSILAAELGPVAIAVSLMLSIKQASRILMRFPLTAFCAILRRRDGFTTFFDGFLEGVRFQSFLSVHLLKLSVFIL